MEKFLFLDFFRNRTVISVKKPQIVSKTTEQRLRKASVTIITLFISSKLNNAQFRQSQKIMFHVLKRFAHK